MFVCVGTCVRCVCVCVCNLRIRINIMKLLEVLCGMHNHQTEMGEN